MNNTTIRLELLDPSPTNPRTHFDPDYIKSLAENFIAHTRPDRGTHGVKQSLLVRPRDGGRYEIVAGECRYRGAKMAPTLTDDAEISKILAELPCRVEELTDREVLELQLVENVKRTDLTGVEEARGYKRLLDLKETDGTASYTVEKIAGQIGKSADVIYLKLKLLSAPEVLLKALEDKVPGISERHCVLVARVPDPKLREEAAAEVMAGEYDQPEIEGGARAVRPLTINETKALLREKYMVSLKGAPWKLEDAELLPDAGPCAGCQYLAREFLQGTGELSQAQGKGRSGGIDPLTCCNPACHDGKMKAHFAREAAVVKSDGGKVLTAAEAKKLFYPSGGLQHTAPFVMLDEKPGYEITGTWDDSKTPSYRELLEKAEAKPKLVIAMTPKGEVVKMVDKKAALELAKNLKAKGGLKGEKKKETPAEIKAREARSKANKISERTKVLALSMLAEHIGAKGIGLDEQMGHIELALHHAGMDGCRLVAEWLECKPEKAKGQHLDQRHYRNAIMAHLRERGHALPALQAIESVIRVAKEVKQWGWVPECYKILARAHAFDPKDVDKKATKLVTDELDAKAAKKAARNAPPPKKPASVSKSAAAARNAKVNDAEEKARDKISKGKLGGAQIVLAGGSLEPMAEPGARRFLVEEKDVSSFAKRLMEMDIAPSQPNENGVFATVASFKLKAGLCWCAIELATNEAGQWATGYHYDSSKPMVYASGGGLPRADAMHPTRYAAVMNEIQELIEHLPKEYSKIIEALKDARAVVERIQAASGGEPASNVMSIEEFAKEMGMKPVKSDPSKRAGPEDSSTRAKALAIYKKTGSLKQAADGSGAKLDAVRNWKRRDAAWK